MNSGRDSAKKGPLETIFEAMNPPVFLGSAFVVITFVTFGAFFTEIARTFFFALQEFIVTYFGWSYVLSATIFLGFTIWLMCSRYGEIRLGEEDSKPEFSYFSWFGMLFCAGMGTGLVFWGVAEPLSHYLSPPFAEGKTHEAMKESLRFSFLHWGFHPWAIYAIFAASLAYFHFRLNLPLAPRSILYPIFGERIRGWIGHIIDIMCTVGTLFGVSTSLGLGAMQINAGLGQVTAMPQGAMMQITIIACVTLVATISVVSGIHKGIQRLSQTNIILAFIIMLFVFLFGPTLFQTKIFLSTFGDYLQNIIDLSFWVDFRQGETWQKEWTLFYWSWWISWSPFVGVFVARISKGRTLREFLITVLFVPSIVTFVWMSIFGGTALNLVHYEGVQMAERVQENPAFGLHALLGELPLASVTSIIATLVVLVFFVTSSDSGSLVDDMVTSGGHPNPPTAQRVFWAVSEGSVAAVLLYAGGLRALQTAALQSGLPLTIILILTCVGFVKMLRKDYAMEGEPEVTIKDKSY